jgi:hypothetical protein
MLLCMEPSRLLTLKCCELCSANYKSAILTQAKFRETVYVIWGYRGKTHLCVSYRGQIHDVGVVLVM